MAIDAMSDESIDGKAYFIFTPRNGEEFQQPHLIDHEKPYRIVGNIALSSIDYENVETDMLVERKYLEPYEECCRTGEIYACVLVHKKADDQHGFLVIPDSGGYIQCALGTIGELVRIRLQFCNRPGFILQVYLQGKSHVL